jgi:hypothetical protein
MRTIIRSVSAVRVVGALALACAIVGCEVLAFSPGLRSEDVIVYD